MEFLTFHVALDQGEAAHPNQTLKHKEYLSMIDMMFSSARLFDRHATRVVLTDEATSFGRQARHIDRVVRHRIDGARLMLERANAQQRYVQACSFETPLVILDSDILVNAPLASIFARDFDVAVTWRHNAAQPINGGFLVLNNRRPDVVRAFFRRFIETYKKKYAEGHAGWFGDQLALRDCVGLPLCEMERHEIVEVDGCRILLLSCDSHNYSPDNRFSEIAADLPAKVILHFKGERKRLMAPYWRAWLRPRASISPLVQFRARQERKAIERLAAADGANGANGGSAALAGDEG